ncbi:MULTISPECIES: acyltransferase family protein [Rhodomicrobium]|uniref:acyltransferase family protein n=1 Tax=Rhodomicrobium TaxID=1068 RepID=UPI000B4BEE4E|nr:MULTISPECIES: acyltransferase family protein [Rhodomicrobium]
MKGVFVTSGRVRIDIQALRAIAVAAVVLFHFRVPGFRGGYVGVDMFFVISGFLMTSIIAGKLAAGAFRYSDFLRSRAARIYPPMLALLLTVIVLGYFFLSPADYNAVAKRALFAVASVANIRFYTESLDYFAPAQQANWLLHLWSLSVEVQFYVLYPLLLIAACRLKRLALLLLLLGAASLAASVAVTPHHQSAAFFLLPARIWEFVLGGLVWIYGRHLPPRWGKPAAVAGLALIFLSIMTFREAIAFPGWIALLPAAGTALVIAARQQFRLFDSPLTQWLGAISYSLYLWHWPVWIAAQHYGLPPAPLTAGLLILVSAGLGAASYHLIERRPLGFRLPARRIPGFAVNGGAFALVACSAFTVTANQGFPGRVPEMIRDVVPHFVADRERLTGSRVCFLKLDEGPSAFTDRCFERRHGGAGPTVFVWGDSYAAHIGLGIDAAPGFDDINLIGTTSPGCFPVLDAPAKFNRHCTENNARTLAEIDRVKPDTIILGGRWLYAATDGFDIAPALARTADFLLAKGIKVVVIGPNPEWLPTLSARLLQESFARGGVIPDRMTDASQKDGWALDRRIAEALTGRAVKYVSLYKLLCSAEGCRTTVPREGERELTVYDYGHLTIPAAAFIAAASFGEADLR